LRNNEKKHRLPRKNLVLLAAAALLFILWRQADDIRRTFFNPLLYETEIKSCAREYGLEPWLIAAVIKNESGFKAGVVSRRGALGLMQIMPETGGWIAGKMNWPDFEPELLLEPMINIRLGCWYLQDLRRQFKDREALVIAAYNAGRGQVESWLSGQDWDGADTFGIPFAETREYVRRVLNDKENYRRLYEHIWLE
jgi:soluble lytic murein transglycosylase